MRSTWFTKLVVVAAMAAGCAVDEAPDAEDSTATDLAAIERRRCACDSVQAVFFDLGETLVTRPPGAALFVEVPGATALLDELDRARVPVGIITNVPAGFTLDDLRALLADPSLLDRFDVVQLSSEASAPKPAPSIYLEAHAALAGAPPIERTAFVTEELSGIADRADDPTLGARAAGMVGVFLSTTPSPLADHTIAPSALPSLATAPWLCRSR
jgi:FMN phosphatase YigB (HAD superfamily)